MTTGRINQVANPSSTRGRSPSALSPKSRRGVSGGGVPAELQRSAVGVRTGPASDTGCGAGPPGGSPCLGLCRCLARPSSGGVNLAVVLRDRGPVAHPFGTRFARLTRSQGGQGEGGFRLLSLWLTATFPSRLGLGRAPSCLGSGPFDALGIEFPTDESPFGR